MPVQLSTYIDKHQYTSNVLSAFLGISKHMQKQSQHFSTKTTHARWNLHISVNIKTCKMPFRRFSVNNTWQIHLRHLSVNTTHAEFQATMFTALTITVHGFHVVAIGGDAARGGGSRSSRGARFNILIAARSAPGVSRYCWATPGLLPTAWFILHHLLLTASCNAVPWCRVASTTASGRRGLGCLLLS